MPVAAKPLFRPDVMARRVQVFVLPERAATAQGVLRKWAALIGGPQFGTYGSRAATSCACPSWGHQIYSFTSKGSPT